MHQSIYLFFIFFVVKSPIRFVCSVKCTYFEEKKKKIMPKYGTRFRANFPKFADLTKIPWIFNKLMQFHIRIEHDISNSIIVSCYEFFFRRFLTLWMSKGKKKKKIVTNAYSTWWFTNWQIKWNVSRYQRWVAD